VILAVASSIAPQILAPQRGACNLLDRLSKLDKLYFSVTARLPIADNGRTGIMSTTLLPFVVHHHD